MRSVARDEIASESGVCGTFGGVAGEGVGGAEDVDGVDDGGVLGANEEEEGGFGEWGRGEGWGGRQVGSLDLRYREGGSVFSGLFCIVGNVRCQTIRCTVLKVEMERDDVRFLGDLVVGA